MITTRIRRRITALLCWGASAIFMQSRLIPADGQSTSQQPPSKTEQANFSMERVGVLRPVAVPTAILEILRQDQVVQSCVAWLTKENESPAKVSKYWFIASQIHLDGPNEIDLIVMPRTPSALHTESRCLFGANVMPFWIFRESKNSYQPLFSESAHDLRILDSKARGYRDLEIRSNTATAVTSSRFKFDGEKYILDTQRTD